MVLCPSSPVVHYLGNMRRGKYLKWNLPLRFVIYELLERVDWNTVQDPGNQDTSKVGLGLWRQSNQSKTATFHLSQHHPNPWSKHQTYLFHQAMKLLIKLLVPHLGLEKNHITAMPEYVLIVYFSVCNASKSQSLNVPVIKLCQPFRTSLTINCINSDISLDSLRLMEAAAALASLKWRLSF